MHHKYKNIYREIHKNEGDFGDSIAHLIENPIPKLLNPELVSEEKEGLGICLLCWLTSAIDNTDYQAAKKEWLSQVKAIIHRNILAESISIESALMLFIESEAKFNDHCAIVYSSLIKPKTL